MEAGRPLLAGAAGERWLWAGRSLKDAVIPSLSEMQVLYFINSIRGYMKHLL